MDDAMKRRAFLAKAAGAAAGAAGVGLAGSAVACGADGQAQGGAASGDAAGMVSGPRVTWRVASSFPRGLDILYGGAEVLAQRVSRLTGGRFTMRVYPAGELVPGLQVMDAVQQGTVQAGHTASYYYIGKNPAFAFEAGVPFGMSARQQNAWLYHGGGLEATRKVFSDFGIVNFPCGNTGCQMGGWFRQPLGSSADLNGLRMRIPGLGGEVMSRMGVTVQVLAGGDIYPALERGAIDATEWVGPYDDEKLGFADIAKNYYYPGWWEPGPTLSLHVNQKALESLPDGYRRVLESAAEEANHDMLARFDAANPPALQRLVQEKGVNLRKFPDDVMRKAEQTSRQVLGDLASKSPEFRTLYDGWRKFRETSFTYFSAPELAYADFAFPRARAFQV